MGATHFVSFSSRGPAMLRVIVNYMHLTILEETDCLQA